MTTTRLKEKLHEYIDTAPEKKLKAFYTIIEDTIETNDIWADKEFVAEMDRRKNEYLSGEVKALSLPETLEMVKNTIQKAQNDALHS